MKMLYFSSNLFKSMKKWTIHFKLCFVVYTLLKVYIIDFINYKWSFLLIYQALICTSGATTVDDHCFLFGKILVSKNDTFFQLLEQ